MKPIETRYHGYRFRSRLEARWAVFLDQCKVKYQYEEQGFRLPSGNYYLPDFALVGIRAFLEIKARHLLPVQHFEFQYVGSLPVRDDLPREIALMMELSSALSCECQIVYGDPIEALGLDELEDGKSCSLHISAKHGPRVGPNLRLFLGGALNDMFFDAAQTARAARFEHGENPR